MKNKKMTGAILIFVLMVIGAVGVKLILPLFEAREQMATSDATKIRGKIRIAMDNWVGYFILRAPEMRNQMRRVGYLLECEDDNADYAKRMKRLDAGEIDFAVATVDSFILNAAKHHYPGAIVMVLDESKGGDAILAGKDKIASLDALKGKTDIRVAFTPNSPSHHLAKAAADHFNVPELLPVGNLRIETEGSEKAREKLLTGKADVAICWEPDVSRALGNKEIVKILGTEDTERLIVDILVANRKFVQKEPEAIQLLLNNYFKVLKKYRENPDLLSEDVRKETGLAKAAVEAMLKGVQWMNFNENCESWFGISAPGTYADEGIIDTIESTVKILINTGDFSDSPIPDKDPYRLINSSFLESLYAKGMAGFTTQGAAVPIAVNSLETKFAPLNEAGWNALREVGTLKVEPILFQQGTTELDLFAKRVVDQAVERLKHYPNFRLVVKGHTDIRGDEAENLRLSQERAEAVARYLKVTYDVNENRIRTIGFGGTKPLLQKPDESRRAWMYRLPRVEMVLVREEY